MVDQNHCEICGAGAAIVFDGILNKRSCPRCGSFSTTPTAPELRIQDPQVMVLFSGWVREQNDNGVIPLLTSEIQDRVSGMRKPGLAIRAARLLSCISRIYPSLRDPTFYYDVPTELEIFGRTYSTDIDDLRNYLFPILRDSGLIYENEDGVVFRLTSAGALEAENMAKTAATGAQGFVAMSFSDEMKAAWLHGFDPAIRSSGYFPMRIDDKEYIGGISDEIIAEIRKSRFLIADYTDQKNGVYFEAGFALGIGLTVIPTVRSDDVKNLHFDIKHLNTLTWDTPADLEEKLSKRIAAVLGRGPATQP